MPTLTTLPFLLLLVFLWRWTRGNTAAIVAFTSIFDAASVVNVGALGIAPWLLALAICLPIQWFQGRLHSRVAAGSVNRVGVYLLVAFVLFAAVSGIALPVVFQGVPVLQLMEQVPLHWGMPNLAQLCYLGAACVVFFVTLTSTPDEIADVTKWYVRGAITAAVIAFYQLASATTHVPFPTAILYSNTAHTVYHAYKINGIWRLNSTFTEASDMAGSLVPALAMLCWDWAMKQHSWKRTLSLGMLFVSILMTLSTTGYLCIALLVAFALPVWFWQFAMRRRLDGPKLAIIALSAVGLCAVFATAPGAREATRKVLNSVVLNKTETESYRDRTQSHTDALETLQATDYLGAGWGSTRASGMAYTLLEAIGIPGTALFALACGAILLPIVGGAKSVLPEASSGRTALAILMSLTAMLLAGSEPIAPVLWILFAAALRIRTARAGAQAQTHLQSRRSSPSPEHMVSATARW